jgi:protein-disulfide isomerase
MKILPALAALIVALPLAACEKGADGKSVVNLNRPDDAFGRKVRAYLLEHPEVIEEAVAKLQEKKQAEAVATSKAELAAARKAIPLHRAALERDARDFVANPDGSITLVQFFDYNCGYCKLAAPQIVQLIEENPDIRFVFKEFPIFGEASDTAAKISLTAAGKAHGLELYQAWMAEKPLDEAAIDRRLKAIGLDPAEMRRAAAAPEIAKQVADVRELAMALKIQGTPAFIVGDTLIPGADREALKAAIAEAKGGGRKLAEG